MNTKSRLLEELKHTTDQDVTEQKIKAKREGAKHTNSRVRGQNKGRLGQIREVGKNEE